MEKVDLMPSKNKMTSKHIDRIKTYVLVEDFPTIYGGKNKTWPLPSVWDQFQKKESHQSRSTSEEITVHQKERLDTPSAENIECEIMCENVEETMSSMRVM